MLKIYTGFSAKTLCSCHFIQNRPLDNIIKDELSPAKFINSEIDEAAKSVRSSFLGVTREAIYRPEMGCTLVSERSISDIKKLDKPYVNEASIFEFDINNNQNTPLLDIINAAFEEKEDKVVNTRAVVIIKDGQLIAEKYAESYSKDTPQMGWSMTKSVTNALVGILVKEGKIDIHKNAVISDWSSKDDPRHDITIDNLLRMSSGLFFEEEYDSESTVNQMLWTKADAGKVAYSQELAHPINTKWYYSSGTTNIISHIIRNQFSDYQDYISFPHKALFDKIGMSTAILETDANGTYVGSSLMYASARDWAKFGLLYLQDGVWQGERILPEAWVDYSRTPSVTVEPYNFYGAHFWINAAEEHPENNEMARMWSGVPKDAYYASGFEGQTVLIVPSKNAVIVRLGQTLDRSAFNFGEFAAQVLEML